MPERKFGALQSLRQQQGAAATAGSESGEPTVGSKGRGRPAGKRSDPNFQPTTVLLRRQTKRAANRLLEDRNTGQDLSDLLEQLLTRWIQES
jgi:hypothetical protein